MNEEQVTLPRETLKILYDLAVGSLDFGSGLWDQEDYEAVQQLAVLMGFEYPLCWCKKPAGHPGIHDHG